jgi:3'-5' exoribonuclease
MEEKGHFINALPDSGLVTFFAVVRERELRPKRSGGVYLHLLLADKTGEVEGRVWDGAEEIAKLFEADDVVKVRGTLERYNGKSQLIVQRIRRCQEEEFDESDFCPVSERHPDEMLAELCSHVERLRSEPLRSLLSRMLGDEDLVRALKVTPGAMRLHHAYRGGLLQHILSVLGLASKLTEHYSRLDLDLLVAGAILHDIGKIEELTATRRLGYSTRGQLVGHVALGLEILERHVARLEDFPLALKSLLQHLIVSHHGEIEKGALREPMLAEAVVLHALDELDARLEQVWRVMDLAPAGEEWTAYAPSLRRQIYCGSSDTGSAHQERGKDGMARQGTGWRPLTTCGKGVSTQHYVHSLR